MKYLTLQNNYIEVKEAMKAANISFADTGKYFRFHSFEIDAPRSDLERIISEIAGREETIPAITEQEFLASTDTREFFMGRQTHMIALV